MSTPTATGSPHDEAPVTVPFHGVLDGPDALGRFGSFGGRFVPETLMDALNQLAEAYEEAKADPAFQERLDVLPGRTMSAGPRRCSTPSG